MQSSEDKVDFWNMDGVPDRTLTEQTSILGVSQSFG